MLAHSMHNGADEIYRKYAVYVDQMKHYCNEQKPVATELRHD